MKRKGNAICKTLWRLTWSNLGGDTDTFRGDQKEEGHPVQIRNLGWGLVVYGGFECICP